MAFTFTSLPLNVYTSVSGYGCGVGLNKNIGGSTDLAKNSSPIWAPGEKKRQKVGVGRFA